MVVDIPEMLYQLRPTSYWPMLQFQGELCVCVFCCPAPPSLSRYVSWRNSEYGSWFVKALVDTMRELASKEHFMDILTEVNRRVAYDFQSRGRNKQIPAPVTMLTRKLYFRPSGR